MINPAQASRAWVGFTAGWRSPTLLHNSQFTELLVFFFSTIIKKLEVNATIDELLHLTNIEIKVG